MSDQLTHRGARLLARWLALELTVMHQDEIARGLSESNLPARLGVPVLDAYSRYRESLPDDVVQSTSYFKDALNEIVAGGRKVF